MVVKERAAEHFIDKILGAFDPIIDPIVGWLRNLFTKLRNRFRRHNAGQPVVLTEAEYDAPDDELPVLLVP